MKYEASVQSFTIDKYGILTSITWAKQQQI